MQRKRTVTRALRPKPRRYNKTVPTEHRISESLAVYQAPCRKRGGVGQLPFGFALQGRNGNGFRDPAFAENKNQPVHRWVPWIAGFSSQFVQDCLDTFLNPNGKRKTRGCVLDPFAGVGTTLFQALLNGYDAVGFEISPYAALACRVKQECFRVAPSVLESCCEKYHEVSLKGCPFPKSQSPVGFRSRIPFFSPPVERQVLAFLDFVDTIPDRLTADIFRLAFGSVMVSFSNYTYEPSLSSRPGAGKPLIEHADVASIILRKLREIISDVRWVKQESATHGFLGEGRIYNADFMQSDSILAPGSIDLMVTSPPYMNNYHYIRNTRPQLYWLSIVSSPRELKALEEANFGKYWQTVRDREPLELTFEHPALLRAILDLRQTRVEKGAYGGPGWANYVIAYFNDSYRFLEVLKRALRRGGVGVIVMGNSIIQGHEIKTDVVLGDIAQQVGFELERIQCIRAKRIGASITQSEVRRGQTNSATLYESAVIVRKK